MAVHKELDKILPQLGFSAVRLWRSSLKPLCILEASRGQGPHEVPANIESMLEDPWMPPQIETVEVADFLMTQKQSGGSKIAADVVNALFAKIGLRLNLQAGSEFTFEFREPALDMVNVYELTKALGSATLNRSVRQRLREQGIMSFVIIRSLKASSIVCHAYNNKGASVALGARVENLPVGGDVSVQVSRDGGVVLSSGPNKELVFGIDFYRLVIRSKRVCVGGRESQTAPTIALKTRVTSNRVKLTFQREWYLGLEQHIEPITGYLSI